MTAAERARRLDQRAYNLERAIRDLEDGISLTGDKPAKLYQMHCEAARLCVRAAALHADIDAMFADIFNAEYHRRLAVKLQAA